MNHSLDIMIPLWGKAEKWYYKQTLLRAGWFKGVIQSFDHTQGIVVLVGLEDSMKVQETRVCDLLSLEPVPKSERKALKKRLRLASLDAQYDSLVAKYCEISWSTYLSNLYEHWEDDIKKPEYFDGDYVITCTRDRGQVGFGFVSHVGGALMVDDYPTPIINVFPLTRESLTQIRNIQGSLGIVAQSQDIVATINALDQGADFLLTGTYYSGADPTIANVPIDKDSVMVVIFSAHKIRLKVPC